MISLVRRTLLLYAVLVGLAIAGVPHEDRIIFQRIAPDSIGLFLSDADGRNERPLLPATSLDYDASFSPDGQWIIFTSERTGPANIYRVRPDGTGLEQLTDSRGFDDQGELSPDGRTLAFVSTRGGGTANIWLLDLASRHAVDLTNGRSGNFRPSWSPDGRWIAFTSDRDTPHRRMGPDAPPPAGSGCCGWELLHFTAVYIVHPDGRGLRRLTPLDQSAQSPKWSSDGRRLIYAEGIEDKEALQLASVDIHTGARRVLTQGDGDKSSPQYLNGTQIAYLQAVNGGKSVLAYTSGIRGPAGPIGHPSWSSNGRLVVYEKVLSAFAPGLAASAGTTPVLLRRTGIDSAFDFYRTDSCVAYSRDGRQLAMTSCFRGSTLMVLNADGSDRRKIFDATAKKAGVVTPAWSPDGKYIAFSLTSRALGSRNPISAAQIALMRSDGSKLRMLTHDENNNAYPSFSPDGKYLVFRILGAHEQGLRILSLADGRIRALTTEWDNFPDWSPRGDRILFTSFRSGDFEIWSIRPDGSDPRQLTHDHGNDAHAIWSPDGTRILFTSSRMGWRDDTGGRSQSYGKLFVMRADGTAVQQLTDDGWEEGPIAWLPPYGVATAAVRR